MKIVKQIIASLLLVSGTLLAQVPAVQVGPNNDTGIARVGSLAVPMGSVNLTNGNLGLAIPLVSLPNRGGGNFTLSLIYNSKIWTPHVSYTNGGSDAIVRWQFERVQHRVGDLGWQLNLPYLDGGEYLDSNGGFWGFGAFVITLPDGSKHSMAGYQSGLDSEDGSGMHLDYALSGSNPTNITVSTADGIHFHFPSLGSTADKITDRNGNYISIDSSTNTITTSAGFQITLDTASWGFGTYYSGVHYKDTSNTTRDITLGFSQLGLFSTDSNSPYYTGSSTPFLYPQASAASCGYCYSHVYVYQPNTAATYTLLTSLTMPDGSAYSFSYNGWGELKKITYPGGGYARYDFPDASNPPTVHAETYWYDHANIPADFRQVTAQYLCPKSSCNPGEEITTKYEGVVDPTNSSPGLIGIPNNVKNTVTVSLDSVVQSKSVHNFTMSYNDENGYIPPVESSVINYAANGSTPLSATMTTYLQRNGSNFLPQAVTQFVCDSSSSAVSTTTTYEYDSASFHVLEPNTTPYTSKLVTYDTIPIGSNVTSKKVYDYVSRSNCGTTAPTSYGTLLREDTASFASGDSNYGPASTAHLLTLPTLQTVKDGGGISKAQTSYEYDVHSGTYHAALASTTGAPQHTSAPGGKRGNLTAVTRTVDASKTITTYTQYNDAGLPVASIDGKHNTTTFTYGGNYLFPTQVTSPISLVTDYYGYNAYTGQVEWHRGPNSPNPGDPQTGYSYDSMLRLSAVNYPDGGQVSFTPNPNWVLQRTKAGTASATTYLYECFLYDGIGRQIQTQHLTGSVTSCTLSNAPSGTSFTDTSYDALGRIASQSNPYYASSSLTDGTTSFSYDEIGRKLYQYHPDGNNLHWTYSGNMVDSYDEAGHHWRRTMDALGRLTKVLEPDPSSNTPSLQTQYTYGPLGNLLTVSQTGASGDVARNDRKFDYDSLSRLTAACNPEAIPAGTTCDNQHWSAVYEYDDNGNLQHKTDARGAATEYTYDALNRLILKSFPGSSTPSQFFRYDTSAPWGWGQTNQIGRLTQAWTDVDTRYYGSGPAPACVSRSASQPNYNQSNNNPAYCLWTDHVYSYDLMGRLTRLESAFPSEVGWLSHVVSAAYDFAGHRTSLTYPDGYEVKQTWSSAGQLQEAALDNWSGQHVGWTLISELYYFPGGQQNAARYNFSDLLVIHQYNNRNQMCQIWTSGTQPYIDIRIHYGSNNFCGADAGNNGNLIDFTDAFSSQRSQQFTYDNLNRLSTFTSGVASQTYSYDSFGNLSKSGTSSFNPTFGANNRINAAGYDNAGNLTSFNNGTFTSNYDYDAESRLFRMGSAYYTYDANGDRMRKDPDNNNTDFTEYQYFEGEPIAEKSADGRWTDYIYANGKRIAQLKSTYTQLHLHGNYPNASCSTEMMQSGLGGHGLTIRHGDLLYFFKKSNVAGGLKLIPTSGAPTYLVSGPTGGVWQSQIYYLYPMVGQTIDGFWPVTQSGTAGAWDESFAAAVIYSQQDGTVTPIFINQPVSYSAADTCSSNPTMAVENVPVTHGTDDFMALTYYVPDHLGSTLKEFSAGPWPISARTNMPFGETIADSSQSHYKFTGKERDPESTLDYFGARYYASGMGRWMSPDPSGLALAELESPQSLNLYSYVLNSPSIAIDPDGLDGIVPCGGDGTAFAATPCPGGVDPGPMPPDQLCSGNRCAVDPVEHANLLGIVAATLNKACLMEALRDTVAFGEVPGAPDNGYGRVVGGKVISAPAPYQSLIGQYSARGFDLPNPSSITTHPGILVQINDKDGGCPKNCSTAYGRYQILSRYGRGQDMSPAGQDRYANADLRYRGADVAAASGNFKNAMELAGKTWQSMPGSSLGRHQIALNAAAQAFTNSVIHCK